MWTDIIQIVRPVADIAIAIAVPILVPYLLRKWGLDIEARHRDALQTAVQNAAGLALRRLSGDVNPSDAIGEATRYVQENAPEAVAKFKLDIGDIATKVQAKMGVVTGATETKPVG